MKFGNTENKDVLLNWDLDKGTNMNSMAYTVHMQTAPLEVPTHPAQINACMAPDAVEFNIARDTSTNSAEQGFANHGKLPSRPRGICGHIP